MKKTVVFLIVFVFCFGNLSFAAFAESEIAVSAKAALVMCMDTKEVLFSKLGSTKMPMASTTKIMTALILAEQPDLSKTVKITKQMITVEGSSMGLSEGDLVSYRDLLFGMILASGNDAANTTAYALGGSIEGFALMMNKKAKKMGMLNTNFVTPSGLDDENHYTTAYDMALLTSYALDNREFLNACSSRKAVLYFGNPPYKRTINNHNKLLDTYDGLIGVKTGFTKKSGRCLVTAAKRNGKTIIAVTLNAPNDWEDHKILLDFGFDNTVLTKYTNNDVIDTIPVIGSDADLVRIKAETVSICCADQSKGKITKNIILSDFIYCPITAGETVGRIEFYLNNKLITTANIYSVADVFLNNKKDKFLKRFLSNFVALWNNC